MAFDEEAAERWYQARVGVRHTDPKDTTSRLRNTQRSMIFDSKDYTGGPLRGAVSDRRAEWMGGGVGGRMGEAWQNHQMIDVDRHGSGLDPISHAIVKGIKGKVNDGRQRRALGRVMKDQTAKSDSEERIAGMRTWRDEPTEEAAAEPAAETAAPVEPAKPKRTQTPEQRDKANARRRELNAQRKGAAQTMSTLSTETGNAYTAPLNQPESGDWLMTPTYGKALR